MHPPPCRRVEGWGGVMLTVTRDMMLPTITGSYPRPLWFDMSLNGQSFKSALGESLFREQYLDAVAAIINAQEAAGLDIVTDGDSRFDLAVGGKSWGSGRRLTNPASSPKS